MLRKLLIIAILFSTGNVFAQEGLVPIYKENGPPKTMAPDNAPKIYRELGSPMPDIRVVTLAQGRVKEKKTRKGVVVDKKVIIPPKTITNKDVDNGANLLVMMFNPTCSHCEDQTDLLEKNIFLFKKSKLLMVAAPMMGPYMEDFEKKYHTDQYSTILIGLDSNYLIDRAFLYKELPQINIYDKDRKLIKVFTGNVPIDSLKSYIE